MNLIRKALSSLKKDGLFRTIKKVLRFVKYKILIKKEKNVLLGMFDIMQFETIIIFENNFGWNKIMKQRPQQIASSLPENTLMFYHSHEDIDYNKKIRINKLKDNLVLIDLGYYREELFSVLASHNNKYLMIYSTDFIPYDRIKMYKDYDYEVIYEYVDDFNEDLNGKEMYQILKKRHKQIVKDNPFVICTATELYNNCINEKFKYVKLVTNGVDYDHFKRNEYDAPKDLIKIRSKYKYLICYYGALASWFDYDLIKEICKNKEYGIVLLGQDYDKTLEKSKILEFDNVHYLGKKDYDILPVYGYNIDIFIIPFLINDITKATSPVKVFEYMAIGKPIVTTALNECKKYESVLFSNNHQEFIDNLKKAEKLINDTEYKDLLKKEALENTWQSKAKDIIVFANKSRFNKLQTSVDEIFNKEDYDRVVIWRSPFGWNVPLFQRPQHISKNLAKQRSLVFYEITNNTDFIKNYKKEYDNLYLVNFENYYVNEIFKERLRKIDKPKYLQIYSTNWSMSLDELHEYENDGFKILYEYIDDINPDLAGTDVIPPYIMDKYNYVMNNRDCLVVTTAKALYDDVKNKRGTENLILSCNGVDFDFFQKIDKDYKFEKEFKSVIYNGKINVCYYGALATWFDYELIKKIDAENKYNIILLGIKYDSSYDDSKIDYLKNVHFFGSKDYKVLKNYADKMDVLVIPFVLNSITQATSPLKLFEYMALHKPIITTAMNECKNYKSVQIANSHEEFISLLANVKRMQNDVSYQKLLEKEAKENDWNQKARLITDLLEKVEGDR